MIDALDAAPPLLVPPRSAGRLPPDSIAHARWAEDFDRRGDDYHLRRHLITRR